MPEPKGLQGTSPPCWSQKLRPRDRHQEHSGSFQLLQRLDSPRTETGSCWRRWVRQGISFSKADALNKCVRHGTEKSSGLPPWALPSQYSGFVLPSYSVWEVGSGIDGPYFVLCTSLQSLPSLRDFCALLKTQEAQESNITEAFGKSCLMLCHGKRVQAETGDLP